MLSRVRLVLVATCLVAGGALGWGAGTAPAWLAREVKAALVERAAARGVALDVRALWVDPTDTVTLDGVTLHDASSPGTPFATVGRIVVAFEIDGIFRPTVFVRQVTLLAPDVTIRRSVDGRLNIQALVERVLAPRDDTANAAPRSRWLSRHVPDIEVRGLRASFDDDKPGPSLAVQRLDLRHLRMAGGALTLRNASPVLDKTDLVLAASARIEGMPAAIALTGQLTWPARIGSVEVKLPPDFAVEVDGWRVAIGRLAATSAGKLVVGRIQVDRTDGTNSFALDIQEVAVHVQRSPGPEPELPPALIRRLPAAVRMGLRHVREIAILEPVIVAQRPAHGDDRDEGDDDDDGTLVTPPPAPATPQKPAKRRAAAQPVATVAKKPDVHDGRAVRELLAHLFDTGTGRIEQQLARLRNALQGTPVPLVTIAHGRARYRDERAGPTGEVSDFHVRIERQAAGKVTVSLRFDVPGRKGETNSVQGAIDGRNGDARFSVDLQHVPLQPYAALLPAAITCLPESAVQATKVRLQLVAATRTVALDGSGTIAHLSLQAPRLSRHRLEDFTVTAGGRVTLDLASQRLQLDDGELTVGKVHALVRSKIERFASAPVLDFQVQVPTVACQDLVDAVPRGFAPMLDGMRCTGQLSLAVRGALDTADMTTLRLDYEPALGDVEITTLGRYIRFDVFEEPFEHHARQKDGSLHTFVTGPGSEAWVPLDAISGHFTKVLFTTEDGGFFGHRGFSWESIKSATVENLKRGRFARGASTITQQLVKNLFFVEREKTISRKVQEAVTTWQIERTLEKRTLLALYLNIIELGPRIYGIKAAAQHYFNRAPAELTLLQALWLASIVPNPRAFYHQFREGMISDNWKTYLCWIADVMLQREKITPDERARLGTCTVVFGSAADGSEPPPDDGPGLGHEGDPDLGVPVPGDGANGTPAPSVGIDQQP
ncbi:MAG: DUF748 domain-containing protein [Myxococcales bacterium]|nr:DUF748 domain-containing protein [Myxococcales bacterium]